MVPIAEILFALVVTFVGVRWYLRTPMHRVRKTYGVHLPDQMAGWHGFGMYSKNQPTLLPHALHVQRDEVRDKRELDAEGDPGLDDH